MISPHFLANQGSFRDLFETAHLFELKSTFPLFCHATFPKRFPWFAPHPPVQPHDSADPSVAVATRGCGVSPTPARPPVSRPAPSSYDVPWGQPRCRGCGAARRRERGRMGKRWHRHPMAAALGHRSQHVTATQHMPFFAG